MYDIQHCFIFRSSDSTVSGGGWDRTQDSYVATTALAVRRSNHSARSHEEEHLVETFRILCSKNDEYASAAMGIPLQAGLWIRIHFIRIQIQLQHFRLNTDPDPDPDPGL